MADKQSKNKFYLKMIMTSLARRRARMLTALLAIAMGATIISGLVTIYYDIPISYLSLRSCKMIHFLQDMV